MPSARAARNGDSLSGRKLRLGDESHESEGSDIEVGSEEDNTLDVEAKVAAYRVARSAAGLDNDSDDSGDWSSSDELVSDRNREQQSGLELSPSGLSREAVSQLRARGVAVGKRTTGAQPGSEDDFSEVRCARLFC